MRILGIETTCDETAVGIVEDRRKILSSVVASSVLMHKQYGGVVPEIAARDQVSLIVPVVTQALTNSKLRLEDIDAIAVAYGPGLIGSLLVGTETAKTLAAVLEVPLIAVNHLVGHIYANWLPPNSKPPDFPLVSLVVSGGHTDLVLMRGHGKYRWLGGTRDDACGEAFDKVARLLGLGYPGGPEIERLAASYQKRESKYRLPRPMIASGDFDFSFSGLKTAVVNLVGDRRLTIDEKKEIAFEFQEAVVEVLATKTIRAARQFDVKSIVVGGGVAANSQLRSRMSEAAGKNNLAVFFPEKNLSVDNGAMIAAAAFFNNGRTDPLKLQADPSLHF